MHLVIVPYFCQTAWSKHLRVLLGLVVFLLFCFVKNNVLAADTPLCCQSSVAAGHKECNVSEKGEKGKRFISTSLSFWRGKARGQVRSELCAVCSPLAASSICPAEKSNDPLQTLSCILWHAWNDLHCTDFQHMTAEPPVYVDVKENFLPFGPFDLQLTIEEGTLISNRLRFKTRMTRMKYTEGEDVINIDLVYTRFPALPDGQKDEAAFLATLQDLLQKANAPGSNYWNTWTFRFRMPSGDLEVDHNHSFQFNIINMAAVLKHLLFPTFTKGTLLNRARQFRDFHSSYAKETNCPKCKKFAAAAATVNFAQRLLAAQHPTSYAVIPPLVTDLTRLKCDALKQWKPVLLVDGTLTEIPSHGNFVSFLSSRRRKGAIPSSRRRKGVLILTTASRDLKLVHFELSSMTSKRPNVFKTSPFIEDPGPVMLTSGNQIHFVYNDGGGNVLPASRL